jgi:hypothetical protein
MTGPVTRPAGVSRRAVGQAPVARDAVGLALEDTIARWLERHPFASNL